MADNKESALEVLPGYHFQWKLQTASDEDWFLWQNKTADRHDLSASFTSPGGKNFDLEAHYVTAQKNGYRTSTGSRARENGFAPPQCDSAWGKGLFKTEDT
ncbi:hypothetical protein P9126_19650 [Bacillus glycinifermentans]|uniref:hypothetical protein n=1 Tax=Bacillus glycinifermentans TaxID=1664069 RepID=UPI002DBF0305|nr:hypothetical protein [Bacillus glycinifermentans]MEC3609181.1 hypothetical protein [Bacillus glycinifermentans]